MKRVVVQSEICEWPSQNRIRASRPFCIFDRQLNDCWLKPGPGAELVADRLLAVGRGRLGGGDLVQRGQLDVLNRHSPADHGFRF